MSNAAHARFHEKYGQFFLNTEPLAHMTLAEAYMTCYLRLLVVNTHFPVHILNKVPDEFPQMFTL